MKGYKGSCMKELYEIVIDLKKKVDRLEKRIKKLENDPTLFNQPQERFKPPTVEEVRSYFRQNGYNMDTANKAFKYYSEAGWKDSGGKQVRNWKQKMVAVWFRDENRIKKAPNSDGGIRKDYGVPSPNAVPMPDSLRNRIKNIGNEG